MFSKDQRLAAVLFVVGAVYYLYALRIPAFPYPVPVDADAFPQALGVLLMALSAVLLVQGRAPRHSREAPKQAPPADPPPAPLAARPPAPPEGEGPPPIAPEEPESDRPLWQRANVKLAVVIAAMILYVLLLEHVGFLIVTAAFLFGVTWFIGYRNQWINAAVAVIFAAGMYYSFTVLLKMSLPEGVLEWIR